MSATFIIDEKTGQAYARVLLSSERASTFHSDHIMLDKAAAGQKLTPQYVMLMMNWNGIELSILLMCEMDYVVSPQKRDGKSLLEKPKKVALQLSEKQTDE